MSVYLYDLAGEVIAFRRTWTDPCLFDTAGHLIGWFPWDDNDAADLHGSYLGTVVDDRLVRRNDWCGRHTDREPVDPGPVVATGRPPAPHYFPNRFAYEDARILHDA